MKYYLYNPYSNNGILKEKEGRIEAPIGRSRKDRKKMAVDPEGRAAVYGRG